MSESWSGYKRSRTVPKSVRRAEVLSRFFIGLGGYGTIIAVVTIFGYLLAVIAPLFASGDMEPAGAPIAVTADGSARIVRAGVDELGLLAWTLDADGRLVVRRIVDGSQVSTRDLFGDQKPTAWAFAPGSGQKLDPNVKVSATFAAGFEDGTLRSGEVVITSTYVDQPDAPESQRTLAAGAIGPLDEGAFQVTPKAQVRMQVVTTVVTDPAEAGDGAIMALDVGGRMDDGLRFALIDASGHIRLVREVLKKNMMTGEVRRKLRKSDVPHEPLEAEPFGVYLDGVGGSLLIVGKDGRTARYDVRDGVDASLVEPTPQDRGQGKTLDLVPGDAQVTAVTWLNGKTTLVIGDDRGGVRAWFGTKPDGAATADGVVFRLAHVLPSSGTAVRAFHGSSRERLLAVGYDGGAVRVFQVTAATEVASSTVDKSLDIETLCLAPKDDEVVAFGRSSFQRLALDPGYSEVTLATLFRPVWYEGAPKPEHVWQSTGGTDDFEPKLGMWPLVFGTLKATFYCILIAGPLALLAAIYTSEFLSPKAKAPIKSVVEMMAGLPSVVLGFLGGLILAPFVQDRVGTVLAAFATVPFAFVLGARLWQFLPGDVAIRWEGLPRVLAQALALFVGLAMATGVGPLIERTAFGGDFTAWLAGGPGSATVGFALLLLPLSVFAAVFFSSRVLGPALHSWTASFTRTQCAVVDLVRLGVVTAGIVLLSLGLGLILSLIGMDPRGGVFGPYSQKNSLIVGFVMGFAVIPIIYTLAEDALSSVPKTLREGSLGSGATPWQTAWRITIPTAMSGLFSALMVGLGRAVGETMIVLMATGNTPILDTNLFDGFRTLAANLAVELPEAAKGTMHFRTLFLAAFILFLMTFCINTVAEMVRRTFRKRAAQL
ncbi:MAG: ABC transporter permease subunit [Planctomycetota bacterium]